MAHVHSILICKGRQSDKYGNTVQWWTEKTLENYEERAKCFIDQYSNYTVLDGTRVTFVIFKKIFSSKN